MDKKLLKEALLVLCYVGLVFLAIGILIALVGCSEQPIEAKSTQNSVLTQEPTPTIYHADYSPGIRYIEMDLKDSYTRPTVYPYLNFNVTVSTLNKDCNITLTNKGSETHTFKMNALSQNRLLGEKSKVVQPKETALFRWVAPNCTHFLEYVPSSGQYSDKMPFLRIYKMEE